jgi:hypothetical protein
MNIDFMIIHQEMMAEESGYLEIFLNAIFVNWRI